MYSGRCLWQVFFYDKKPVNFLGYILCEISAHKISEGIYDKAGYYCCSYIVGDYASSALYGLEFIYNPWFFNVKKPEKDEAQNNTSQTKGFSE